MFPDPLKQIMRFKWFQHVIIDIQVIYLIMTLRHDSSSQSDYGYVFDFWII